MSRSTFGVGDSDSDVVKEVLVLDRVLETVEVVLADGKSVISVFVLVVVL